jgi:hypothetical protein
MRYVNFQAHDATSGNSLQTKTGADDERHVTRFRSAARRLWQHRITPRFAEKIMQRRNQNALEIDFELATQELLAPFDSATDAVEVDDLSATASELEHATAIAAANDKYESGETMEIELTAEQIDALLSGQSTADS